jgi:formylglycine-generating enzyme required for sulfatase activity
VTISQDFYLGKYEVTKAQWMAVMGITPWSEQDFVLNDPDSPAVYISWNDCQDFIHALNQSGQGTFRLPSEAEWEYACRAGTTTRFYWGDDPNYKQIGSYAWYWGNCSNEWYAHGIGLKKRNGRNLYDMSGNVWEWCQDWYGIYSSGAVTDPVGSASGDAKVLRGGGWYYQGDTCRTAYRYKHTPVLRRNYFGFRLARNS